MAMVEPVFGFCTDEEYRNFLKGVVGFEKDLVRQGTILVAVLQRHQDDLRPAASIGAATTRCGSGSSARSTSRPEHWDDFTRAKYRMLRRTSTPDAPWTIIRSENKHKARLNAIKVILDAVPYDGRSEDIDFVPDPEIVISGASGDIADGGRPDSQRQVHRVTFTG